MEDRPTAEVVGYQLVEIGYEKPFRDDHLNGGIPPLERELDRKLRLCGSQPVL